MVGVLWCLSRLWVWVGVGVRGFGFAAGGNGAFVVSNRVSLFGGAKFNFAGLRGVGNGGRSGLAVERVVGRRSVLGRVGGGRVYRDWVCLAMCARGLV